MELEMDVEDLLNKRKLESDRIEFKMGWNPDDIYHSVCAFANDYNNDGGGYIVVGVEEENGVAKRPVKGLPEYMLDSIQKDMLGYNNLISPPYFPQGIPMEVDEKWIFIIVVRTGQQRPYKSPEHVTSKKEKKYNYYIRYQTSSVKANSEQERELINMSDQTPFDCRANHKATFEDISPVLLEDHLRKTGSKLAKQVRERGVEEILNDMQLLVGPPELRYIQNVAIMMFCEHPEKFFGYTYVQMTSFPKGSIENPSISEDFPNITGSVPQMIQATMERFRNLIIREKVIKVPNQMEALRIFNYPYQAIEEAVVNAFYHRDYMSFEPVTIEIEPDCINIMNFPGIDRYYSPFVVTRDGGIMKRKELRDILPENNREVTLIPQILTNHAENFLCAAETMYELGYQEVNLNLGCPSGTVTGKGRGSGFLKWENRSKLQHFLEEIYQYAKPKISIKTRIGWEDPEEFTDLLQLYNTFPICELTIHPRTRTEMYREGVHREIFRQAYKTSVNPVCYNGDIKTEDDVRELGQEFPQLSSVMIGRGLLSNPGLVSGIVGKDTGKQELEAFYYELFDAYQQELSGDVHLLHKMKELWIFMAPQFTEHEKYLKQIKKSRKLSEYETVVRKLFYEQELA